MHVSNEKLEDYRALRAAMEVLDTHYDKTLGQGTSPGAEIKRSLSYLRTQMMAIREKGNNE